MFRIQISRSLVKPLRNHIKYKDHIGFRTQSNIGNAPTNPQHLTLRVFHSILNHGNHQALPNISRNPRNVYFTKECHKVCQTVQCMGKNVLPQSRGFSTSRRNQVHPFFWIIAKPMAKIASVITGRTLRKLFQRLPKEQRIALRQRLKDALPAVFIGIIGFTGVSYITHVQETPITKRRRYLAFTDEQFMQIAEFEYQTQMEMVKNEVVPVNSPYYRMVERVIRRLVKTNQDIRLLQSQTWTIHVVQSKERNAFVLPTGHIFVYTGLLDMVQNEDQLAVVMGHEMAHAILSHGAERVSMTGLVDNFIILFLGALWFFIPSDGIAIVTNWFFNKVVELLLDLPYSRKLEKEADEVGLHLMAKACYDVRESSNFWDLMAILAETEEDNVDVPEFFSTHPSNQTRIAALSEMIPKALSMRDTCKCPRLSDRDPRDALKNMKKIIQMTEQNDLPATVK